MLSSLLVFRWSAVEAQPAPGSPAPTAANQLAAARKLTDAALAAEDAKDYAGAIALYQQAYLIAPHPILQFNIGQAYMMAGNLDQAERYYRLYLSREPKGRGAPIARKFLASRPAAPSSQQAPSSTEPGRTATSSNVVDPADHAGSDSRGASVTSRAGEHHPDQIESTSTPSTSGQMGPPHSTGGEALSAPAPAIDASVRLERGHRTKRTGYKIIGGGVALGLGAVGLSFYRGDVGRGVGVAAFLTGVTGVGVCWYANNQITAAKAVTWSPMLGSGFAGIAFAGPLR
jgi:hypothetical protein